MGLSHATGAGWAVANYSRAPGKEHLVRLVRPTAGFTAACMDYEAARCSGFRPVVLRGVVIRRTSSAFS